MAGRVSLGGHEMDLQTAISALEEQLEAARAVANREGEERLNQTIRDAVDNLSLRSNFELVNTIPVFDGDNPRSLASFFSNLEDVGELSGWTEDERFRVAKLRLGGAALRFVQSEDRARVDSYAHLKETLTERFSDKAPLDCYYQQLSVIQQRRGETIEAFADRVRALNEKTVRVTANAEVNQALRGEADRRALDAFLRGLWGGVGEQTRLKFPTTLKDAITTAVAIEHLLKPGRSQTPANSERKVFKADLTCYRCHKRGHTSSECRAPEERDAKSSSGVVCWRCGKKGHMRRNCNVKLPPSDNNKKTSQPPGNANGTGGPAPPVAQS